METLTIPFMSRVSPYADSEECLQVGRASAQCGLVDGRFCYVLPWPADGHGEYSRT
jgi:hypothetical protein